MSGPGPAPGARARLGPLLPLAVFLALVVLAPIALLFGGALLVGGIGALRATAADPLDQFAAENSLTQGALSALAAGMAGYPVGVILGRYRFPGLPSLRAFLLVPFLLPSLVVVLGVQEMFGAGGWFSGLWTPFRMLAGGLPGILAVNTYFNAPLVALLTATSIEGGAAEQEEAVRALGGSPARAYLEVWGPPSWLGAGAGMLLTFLFGALGFAAPLLICGARCYTLEVRVWSLAETLGAPTMAALLALLTVAALTLPALAYLYLLSRSRRRGRRTREPPPLPITTPLGAAAAAYLALFFAAVFALLATVAGRAIAPPGPAPPGTGGRELFAPFLAARVGLSTVGALGNSLLYAAAAATIALGLAILAAYVGRHGPVRGGLLDYLLFLPVLVSPVLLAFGLAEFWRPALGGAGATWLLIVLSQATLALPFAAQSLRLALARLTPGPYEAAQSLGSAPFAAYLDAELPRARSGLLSATLFAFAFGLGEFTATYFLVLPPYTTLTVELLRLDELRLPLAAEALGGLLVLVSLGVFAAVEAGGRRVEL